MSTWQPSPESLNQLAAFLKDSLSGFDKNAQKQAELVRCLRPAGDLKTLGTDMSDQCLDAPTS